MKNKPTFFFKDVSVENQIKRLSENDPNLTRAYFDNSPLNHEQVQQISNALKKNTYLNYLNLACCGLNSDDLTILFDGLKDNMTITRVILDQAQHSSPEYYQALTAINEVIKRNMTASTLKN